MRKLFQIKLSHCSECIMQCNSLNPLSVTAKIRSFSKNTVLLLKKKMQRLTNTNHQTDIVSNE